MGEKTLHGVDTHTERERGRVSCGCGSVPLSRPGAKASVLRSRTRVLKGQAKGGHRLTKSSEQPLFVARAEPKKGGLTREEEPEEYWMDANTKAGKSPMQDPLAIIGVIAIFSPFVILAIAYASGYIEL